MECFRQGSRQLWCLWDSLLKTIFKALKNQFMAAVKTISKKSLILHPVKRTILKSTWHIKVFLKNVIIISLKKNFFFSEHICL